MYRHIIEEFLEQIGMFTPALFMGLGLVVGIQHAFEPDHIAAVNTLVSEPKFTQKSKKQFLQESLTKSSVLGTMWGMGHTTTLVLMGFLVYVFSITIDNQVFSGFELTVGIMLILLGLTTSLNKKITFKHKHLHQHRDGTIHFGEHIHADSDHKHGHKSYVIGLIHGLAGSGSLVVLTASISDNVETVLAFIAIFGIGSIIGMALVSCILGLPFILSEKIPHIQKIARYCSGTFSFILGINLLFNTVVLENSFDLNSFLQL